MRASNRGVIALVVALGAIFLYGLWRLYDLRFSAGDVYPPYSSLRADPLGAMAFYEGIGQLPGFTVERNFVSVPEIPRRPSTVFFLGVDPFTFRFTPEDRVKEYEALASAGARVVIAMEPVRRAYEKKPDALIKDSKQSNDPKPPAVEKRWKVTFGYVTKPESEPLEDLLSKPKLTALYFEYQGKRSPKVELPFGRGAVVLLSNSFPMSNEALAGDRNARLLADALGANHAIVFDEHHFGISEEGGVANLARKYHLEGMGVALLALLALFIWKNSTSFLPARPAAAADESIAAKDAASGLANLLRRNVANKKLLETCFEQWDKSQHGGRFYSRSKIERVRRAAQRGGEPAETYRQIAGILAERSDE